MLHFAGATATHFAIAYDNSKLVKKLVEVGASILQRANGTFFMPIDQQWPIPRKKTNFEGKALECTMDKEKYETVLYM